MNYSELELPQMDLDPFAEIFFELIYDLLCIFAVVALKGNAPRKTHMGR